MTDKQHQTGATSELFAAYMLAEQGYKVYFPFMTQSKADLVIEARTGNFYKIQVKTATEFSKGYIQIRLGGCGRSNYKEGDFDFLAMVYKQRLWIFPWSFVKDKKSMSFSIETKNSRKGTRSIEEFEICH